MVEAVAPIEGQPGSPTSPVVPGGVLTRRASPTPFEVHLDVYSGPFELLLGLIAKHKLDITEVALAQVTDEFIDHIRSHQDGERSWDLDQASEFLLVAATLLELKSARLLPGRPEGDEEDLALIEARDLLFARLLQYRAFKEMAAWCAERMAGPGRIVARRGVLEARFAALLPEVVLGVSPEQLAMIAAKAMQPRTVPTPETAHLHEPSVNMREQDWVVRGRLRRAKVTSFRSLVVDADVTLVIVARFLVLLNLFQSGVVTFDQVEPYGDLMIRWVGDAGDGVSPAVDGSNDD